MSKVTIRRKLKQTQESSCWTENCVDFKDVLIHSGRAWTELTCALLGTQSEVARAPWIWAFFMTQQEVAEETSPTVSERVPALVWNR